VVGELERGAEGFRDAFADGQSEAHAAAIVAVFVVFGGEEGLEKAFAELGRDAWAVICDAKHESVAQRLGVDLDAFSARRSLDCIDEQVQDDLLEGVGCRG
jgi:hypothetical protein